MHKKPQDSFKFQSTFAPLGNDLNISDDLLTKLEEFVCHICCMLKKYVNEFLFNAYIWKRCLEASFEHSSIADHG